MHADSEKSGARSAENVLVPCHWPSDANCFTLNRMVNYLPSLDETFGALSDPTRRAILQRLERGQMPVSALAQPFAMSLPAVLKHLHVLERAGLVAGEKQGRRHLYRLRTPPLEEAAAWIDRYRTFWNDRLTALEHRIQELPPDD
ncbi:MAG TPA: metalloregulator ArsR/SmtB family transcription factor [Chloroflexota bacterium]